MRERLLYALYKLFNWEEDGHPLIEERFMERGGDFL